MLWHTQEPEMIDWDEYWKPQLFVENLLGEAKETIWYTLTFNDHQHCTVYEKRRINGTFLEYLELEQFPFDTQVETCISRDLYKPFNRPL